jgi:phosphomethylpyrimidine synthase
MITQMQAAKEGKTTKEMEIVAKEENISLEKLKQGLAEGKIVIPANPAHKSLQPLGIGQGLRTKINANIGTSQTNADFEVELEKLRLCLKYGAHAVMDLSIGGNLNELREKMLKECTAPFGTVCTYQAVKDNNGEIASLTEDDFINAFETQAKQGVDFITVHAGLLKEMLPLAKKRLTGIVSRGGAILAEWMTANNKENPYYTNFDKILKIAAKHDVTLSLGDGLRPGSLKDASDEAQIAELKILGNLTQKAWQQNVQIIIEGPGHVPLNQIKENVEMQKKYCHGAPFYVLGPLVTDIAPGYDHITSAIGSALAGAYGTDFLCYVTPSEHLGFPNAEDVRQGIIASLIAAHAADIAKGLPQARAIDDEMSSARANFDWKKQFSLALDSEKAREIKCRDLGEEGDYCSMCGPEFCPMKIFKVDKNAKED